MPIISKMVGDRDSVTGALTGNGTWKIKWSRDRIRHVTLTGRGRDTNMLAPIIFNYYWRYTLSYDFM